MNAPGVLLDTGPLVALLSKDDAEHSRAKRLFSECQAPFRCVEGVLAEACFLMQKVHPAGPAEVIALGRKSVFEVAFSLEDHWSQIETLMKKYADRPISLADACLIRCAEVFQEPRVLTFDSDFGIYRWSGKKRFRLIAG
ncbi:MAG TPA: PIN domain-containing protein [Terriglobia bacterium]|nr:PIN domain-containing protein [Terriglobia bacterium]